MTRALALIEFEGVAAGVLAVDRMLKRSPVALLRCGTVHPGRYLALVGGTVASTEEAHAAGVGIGCETGTLTDEVLLPDPHPALDAAVGGSRRAPAAEAVGVLEIASSPGLLRVVDAALKAVPVDLVEIRLADDLGGRAVAVLDGSLADVEQALAMAPDVLGDRARVLGTSLLPRLDETLRGVLGAGTAFADCAPVEPAGAETVEEA